MATFLVDGQERVLRMDVNGIDWSNDFIGNFDHGMDIDANGRYICGDADYAWWVKAMSDQLEADALIDEYRSRYDDDDVDAALVYVNTDPEEYLDSVKRCLAELDA